MIDSRPVLLVTNTVPDYRREPFRVLAQSEGIELIAWGDDPGGQRAAVRAAGSGRHRAVIAGLGGRVALPGSFLAARRAGIPFVLWASLWSHPGTLAHRASLRPLRAIYRGADAIATYGPHVSRYVSDLRGGDEGVFEAPQSVDVAHFSRAVPAAERAAARVRAGASEDEFLLLFAGRLEEEKGVRELLAAWRYADLDGAVLAFAGDGPMRIAAATENALGTVSRSDLPALYATADALVLPSIRTATFTEPWGLVCNEAMHQATPVIASDAVGAAAGGLVRDGATGLVVPAGDASALAAAISTVAGDPGLRARLGAAAQARASAYTPAAWAAGMSRALRHAGAGRGQGPC